MQPHDTGLQGVDPVFRPSVPEHISDIEIPADQRVVEFIDKSLCFYGAEDKVVPNVFQGNLHTRFFSMGNQFSDRALRGYVRLFIGYLFIHYAWNDQYGVSTQFFHFMH
ncbi:hypothetical protein SDC9_190086 [bioreactor metagenome]|uniref:Uncharacterized protein n=1 Tax=bioreactor metagenome TaxID=1076179 RepID=A0A645HWF9_9ZZZZ